MENSGPVPIAQEEKKSQFVKNSVLYKEFLAEREEILKHKWIESEKVGSDIGFEKALLDWIVKHRSNWRERRIREAKRLRVPLLGQIPIDIATREAGDRGMPVTAEDKNSPVTAEFMKIARQLTEILSG